MVAEKTIPWFPCFPSKWLKAIAGMKPHVSLTYLVVCFRIYELDGPCKDAADVLARRTGLKKNLVQEALKFLIKAGKLIEGPDGGMTNPFAELVIQDRRAARAKTKKWNPHRIEKAQSDQRNADTQLQLQITDTKEDKKTEKVVRASAPHHIPDDWKLNGGESMYAADQGFQVPKINAMAEAFSDHHRAKGSKFVDWSAAWRTWVRNEIKFNGKPRGDGNDQGPRPNRANPNSGPRPASGDRVLAGLAASAAKHFGGKPPDDRR